MSFPAARVGDMHQCPMVTPGTPPVPHVGGAILPPGVINVLTGNMPAGVIGNMCTCVGPPDIISMGSTSVIIGGRFASRQSDFTAHGGVISAGLATVLIGGPASVASLTISRGVNDSLWGGLLGFLGLNPGDDGTVRYGKIIINPDPMDPNYQGKVLGDLIMIDNTITGNALIASIENSGGAVIEVGKSKTLQGNACYMGRKPPVVEYNPDKERIGPEPFYTRPPAIGLAHELIHAEHGLNGTPYDGDAMAPNDAKPNPASTSIPPQEDLEELNTTGIPPNNTEPFTENKIRSEWHTPQPQRLYY